MKRYFQRSDNATRQKIIKLAFPIMISGVVQQVQVLTDSAFLGHINSDFFSALGNVFFPFFLCLGLMWSIPTGTTVLIAQAIGAGKPEKGQSIAEASFKYNTFLSTGMFLLWIFFGKQILVGMGVQEPILSYAHSYVQILSFLQLTMGIDGTAASVMHGVGISKPLMYIGIMRSLLNILFDWIMIYGKFGFPAMGIQGAALATILSNLAGIPIVLYIVFRAGHLPFKVSFRGTLTAPWKNYLPVIKLGLPAGGEEILWNAGNLMIVRMINSLGMGGAGIYTLVMQIETTPVLLYMGISKAAQTVVGNRTGERNIPLAIRDGMQCLRYTLYVSIAFVLLFLTIPGKVLSIFTNDMSLVSKVAPFLMIAGLYLIPKAVNITIGHGIRGYGDTRWMLYTQIFGTVFIATCGAVFIFALNLGVLGLFFAVGLDETVRAIINFARFLKGERGKGHYSLNPAVS